jgi:exopolysaccharide/PEP-CTERM locus tyrosine autokinase
LGKIFDALEKQKKENIVVSNQFKTIDEGRRTTSKEVNETFKVQQVNAKYNPKLVVLTQPGSIDSENFKTLRAQILFPKDGRRNRVIMVTSVFPGEGKTFVAANLAVSIAQGINEFVLMVDCDLRKPDLHKMVNAENSVGLSNYLLDKMPMNKLLLKTGIEKLTLLPAGKAIKKPSELLASNEMKDFLIEVRNRYEDRFVIVDAAPLGVTSEANILSNHVDGVVFVVRSGKTPKETVKKNLEKIEKDKIIGIVFNGYEQHLKPYGDYYKNYYVRQE